MSKTLYLIRHASAEEPDSRLKDLERRLTAVGRRDANHLGMYLASSQVQPDLTRIIHRPPILGLIMGC